LRAVQRVVGERHAHVQVGRVVPEAHLAEKLPDAARVVQCPPVVVGKVPRRECIDAFAGPTVFEFERAPVERSR
jgi:hypothetical protein